MIYLIAKKDVKTDNWKIALATVSTYGLFNIMIMNNGFYWFSASISYVIPIMFFLLFYYLYSKMKKTIFKNKFLKIAFYIICMICIFFSSFSQEQISFATLFYILGYSTYKRIKTGKTEKTNILMCIISLIGFSILMLAPGNSIRMTHPTSAEFYSLSFINRIMKSIPLIIVGLFDKHNLIFSSFYILIICYCSFKNIKNELGVKLISKIAIISNVTILFFNMTKLNGYFEYLWNLLSSYNLKYLFIVMSLIQLIVILYTISIYLFNKKDIELILLTISGFLSQAIMVMSPYYASRCTIVFEIISFILIIKVLSDISSLYKKNQTIYLIIPLFIISSLNFSTITYGYYRNSNVNKSNYFILKKASQDIENGQNIKQIKLRKLPNVLYSGEQPYIDGYDYILYYMREYYNLPKDVEIIYEE